MRFRKPATQGGDFVGAFDFSLISRHFQGGDFVGAQPEQGFGVGTLWALSGDFVGAR